MKCEEFEAIGLDAQRDASLDEAQRAAVKEHVDSCSRCAALQNSWQEACRKLRVLAEATGVAAAPVRVEMRLRQEFRTQHRTLKVRRAAVVAAWALATAAVLTGAVSWKNWRRSQREEANRHLQAPQSAPPLSAKKNGPGKPSETLPVGTAGPQGKISVEHESSQTLLANNELRDFTLLPGVLPADTDDAAILRVRMQRGALGVLGLPVNEERAGEWIQVDLLVGNDGLPQAVRLPR